MKITRIITAIITLIVFLFCLTIAILTLIQGAWMVSTVIFMIAGLMSYFVVNDYQRFFQEK